MTEANEKLRLKVMENKRLKEENKNLQRQVDERELVISALVTGAVDKTTLTKLRSINRNAIKEKNSLQQEKICLQNMLNHSNNELLDIKHRISKLHCELTRLKHDTRTNFISKEEHQKALKASEDYVKRMQAEVEVFKNDLKNVDITRQEKLDTSDPISATLHHPMSSMTLDDKLGETS
jgi:hypothetical protein